MHVPSRRTVDNGPDRRGAYHHDVNSPRDDGLSMAETTPSATPSPLARILAFGSIVFAGAAGGFIGWAFVDLQCEGDCTVLAGVVALVVAILAAVGVGVVAVLALRALGEWSNQQQPGATDEKEPGLVLRRPPRTTPANNEPPPRVR